MNDTKYTPMLVSRHRSSALMFKAIMDMIERCGNEGEFEIVFTDTSVKQPDTK